MEKRVCMSWKEEKGCKSKEGERDWGVWVWETDENEDERERIWGRLKVEKEW